ncbi:unnamed protein product [Protopolystoma xenopodis]|uniref:Uncharacterized protein n=1 Tax=Protopolystoma xenopodis TaxID=117903 RepID=A0A3S5CEZ9_9PLAT|nr:unnamed protein product [Protopolystoma xenopodis]
MANLLLDYAINKCKRPVQVARVHCCAFTTPCQILEKLGQHCITVTSNGGIGAGSCGRSRAGVGEDSVGLGRPGIAADQTSGHCRVMRPREGDCLILHLKDLNLVKPDKWGTCQLVAFLQQVSQKPEGYDLLRDFSVSSLLQFYPHLTKVHVFHNNKVLIPPSSVISSFSAQKCIPLQMIQTFGNYWSVVAISLPLKAHSSL